MQKIRLLRVLDPSRKIQAIKALREATRPAEGEPGMVMGLKEAKGAIDKMTYETGATVEVSVLYPECLTSVIAWERVEPEADASRFALRAAVVGVAPSTLDALAVGVPLGSEVRTVLAEAASLLRSVGATG